jgi:hypothetical protein
VRALNNTLNATQQAGKNFFGGSQPVDGINLGPITGLLGQLNFTCNGCHVLNPALGQFGTGTNASFEGIDQIFKVPHLRNMYDKVGMFGMAPTHFFNDSTDGPQGPQVRGFGFTNFHALVFNQPILNTGFPALNPEPVRKEVEQFMLAFDSDLAPIVGQQVTLNSTNQSGATPRLTLLEQRAGAPFTSKILGGNVTECDLVAAYVYQGSTVKLLYSPKTGAFIGYQNGSPAFSVTTSLLLAFSQTPGQEVTFTAVPPGSGLRIVTSS